MEPRIRRIGIGVGRAPVIAGDIHIDLARFLGGGGRASPELIAADYPGYVGHSVEEEGEVKTFPVQAGSEAVGYLREGRVANRNDIIFIHDAVAVDIPVLDVSRSIDTYSLDWPGVYFLLGCEQALRDIAPLLVVGEACGVLVLPHLAGHIVVNDMVAVERVCPLEGDRQVIAKFVVVVQGHIYTGVAHLAHIHILLDVDTDGGRQGLPFEEYALALVEEVVEGVFQLPEKAHLESDVHLGRSLPGHVGVGHFTGAVGPVVGPFILTPVGTSQVGEHRGVVDKSPVAADLVVAYLAYGTLELEHIHHVY